MYQGNRGSELLHGLGQSPVNSLKLTMFCIFTTKISADIQSLTLKRKLSHAVATFALLTMH